MNRTTTLVLLFAATALIVFTARAPVARASDCRRTSVDLTPLTELDPARYQGFRAGLYPEGANSPPPEHLTIAMTRAGEITPLAGNGTPSSTGKKVMLSIGTTMTSLEYSVFAGMAADDPQVDPAILVVDGAQANAYVDTVRDPDAEYWAEVDRRLQAAGASRDQVQVIWLKEAQRRPAGPFPEHAEALRADLEAIVLIAHARFPHLKLLYVSSRSYAGYATSRVNPEPYAYESGLAVQWLIARQIGGEPTLNPDPAKGEVRAPVLLWGPYLWADGETPRQDGLTWSCGDFLADGTHPAPSGRQKVANLLMAFFKTDQTARQWFMVDPSATPIATATWPPTVTPQPTRGRRTPGMPRPTRGPTPTPGPQMSYRIEETPSGDKMWLSTVNSELQRRLEELAPNESLWVCGRVVADDNAEWGWRFNERFTAALDDPPQQLRSTIREIQANPPTGFSAFRCIHVGAVLEKVDGPPPGTTPGTPRASPTPTDTPRIGPALPTPTNTRELLPPAAIYLPMLVLQ